jgi:hypothetical protein
VVTDGCYITVTHKAEFALEPPNSLKSSLKGIIHNGTYSDLEIQYGEGKSLKTHKCILSCRSQVFDKMIVNLPKGKFTLDFRENVKGEKVEAAFLKMVHFIYSGELVFPEDPREVFRLIELANEYKIGDLQTMCEEDILYKIDEKNVKDLLFLFEKTKIVSESALAKCRSVFIKNFESISMENEEIEKEITRIPGLLTNLLLQMSSKKKLRRKVTFRNYEV